MKNRLLLLVGGLFVLASPALFFRSCSDHCGGEGVSLFGTEITAFTGVMISYCTNGSECTAGVGPVLLPLGIVMLGFVLVRR
ncbi:hypothetical protein [Saliphagus sp. LR7]|uniref:hypothetical protein n=1 Tax=Saliphagus sp. LR7 TaxID=2282654 RepID=UPI000DF74627|nr:hypothetical protein [Saliphagus sp. LR7]